MLLLGDPNLFGEREVIGAESGEIAVSLIDKAEADSIIRAGHYSGAVVWSSNLHLGVYLDDRIIGAVQFGPAMNPASGVSIVEGASVDSWLELNRLWLANDKPPNTTSRAISCALKVVRHRRPSVEWVQSFADERCGKLGAVYQACSFTYCGSHSSTFYEIDGEWVHKSLIDRPDVDKRGWGCGPKATWAKANKHRAVPYTFNQYRYVKFLRPAARKRLLLPVLPYPKPTVVEIAA
jgi:hypothetical protein